MENKKMLYKKRMFYLLLMIVAGGLLFAACNASEQAPSADATQPAAEIEVSTATAAPTDVPIMETGDPIITLDTGDLAAGFWVDIVDAVAEGSSVPYWEILPEFSRATLDAYVISEHLMKPQIFVYPVEELMAANEGASMIVIDLQALLDAPQETETMPLLPLFNAAQIMHTQVQYLDFQNGRGVRYLTFLSQGIVPINNFELIYTYQGLTNDGKYYVAAILPVTHPSLPADGMVTGNEPDEFMNDTQTYIANVAQALNVEASNTFTPDLTLLDAMIASMEVK
ncbi:MAG: hypothetical protein V2J07_11050 [Anaerolineae bacterium]|jgi:hypothetical protein|nr:hypothetical protein [Anaerolineae bacterium]